jgi:hypothetical protein
MRPERLECFGVRLLRRGGVGVKDSPDVLQAVTSDGLNLPLGAPNQLKGAKVPAIMQHTYRSDAIHRGQAPR